MPFLIVPGLAAQGILADIPHDGAAIVTYAVLALFVGLVIYGGRKGSGPQPNSDAGVPEAEQPAPSARDGAR